MEIVLIVTGVLALALLAAMSLRRRSSRGGRRRTRDARQWRGSATAAQRSRLAVAAAGGGASTAYLSAGGAPGGVAVQDPPRTGEADLDAWDDDLEWTDDLDAAPEPPPVNGSVPAPVEEPAPTGNAWGAAETQTWNGDELDDDPVHEAPAPAAEPAPDASAPVDESSGEAFRWPNSSEPAWDDDLHADDPAPIARADGDGQPIPSARGAAAFGAATATPAVSARRKRGGVFRSPVVLVALYAAAGIALVVLAVSLLTNSMSPTDSKDTQRTSETQTATPEPPAPTPEAQGPS